MNKYTIITRYPDYAVGGNWPDDMHISRVGARTVKSAINMAKRNACSDYSAIHKDVIMRDDIALVVALNGWVTVAAWLE